MTRPADERLLDLICEHLTGSPAAALDWRALIHVRDVTDAMLNNAVNEAQAKARP